MTAPSPRCLGRQNTPVVRSGDFCERFLVSLRQFILPRNLLPVLACALVALVGTSLRADVNEFGTPGYITYVTVQFHQEETLITFFGSESSQYSWTEEYVLGEYDSLQMSDSYWDSGWDPDWWRTLETTCWTASVRVEQIPSNDPPDDGGGIGSGGGGGVSVDDPWADADEVGVGSLGQFTTENRSSSLPAGAEWLGIAVGIFVEPVDWVMTAVEIYRDPTNPASYLGLIPGVPAATGRLVKAAVNITTDILRNLPLGKILKMGNKDRGMDHILRRHSHGAPSSPGHPSTYDGHFNEGWHMTHVTDAIETALARSNGQYSMNMGNEVYEVMLDSVIGKGVNRTTGAVSDTRKLRVVVDPSSNEIITAYPIPE